MDSLSINQSTLPPGSFGQTLTMNPNSTDSFSGFSSLESDRTDRTVADRLEGVLNNILPLASKVNIQFCIPVLFKNFVQLLEKEFVNSTWNVDNKLSVSSHIQGRKVIITVYEAEKTIEDSGTGHKIWKDIAFKRIANALFTRFMQNLSTDLQTSVSATSVLPQITSTPAVARPSQASVPLLPHAENSSVHQIPVVEQMSAMFELLSYHARMISTLQEQMTSLTSEVVKLQELKNLRKTTHEDNQSGVGSELSRAPLVCSIDSNPSSAQASSTPKRFQQNDSQPKPKSQANKAKRSNEAQPRKSPTQRGHTLSSVIPSNSKILIIGDSIIKGINEKGLKDYVHCHGIPGAYVETVLKHIHLFDLKNNPLL